MPDGLWVVYSSEEECCSVNFPDSTTCYVELEAVPTKHPTISLDDEDGQETIPIQFLVSGVPEDASLNEVKEEMLLALKRVLLRLTEEIAELTVINVEEKLMRRRKKSIRHLWKDTLLLQQQQQRITTPINHPQHHHRALKQSVEVVFEVTVVSHDDIQFATSIIEAIRNSYDDVMSEIQ